MRHARSAPMLSALTLCAALAAAPASAQTVYKLVDKSGKVTYSESVPKGFDGKVTRIDVDPAANTATLPKYEAPPGKVQADRAKQATRVERARERLASAQAALEDAKNNPGPNDVQRVGKVGGGARAVNTDQYEKRIADLERAVKEAEDELREAQGTK
jgi:hypothetical protein